MKPIEKHGAATGGSVTPTYRAWSNMIQRCTNPRITGYRRYGGRGITVCDRWRQSFEAFRSDMGEKPPNMSLDRIDNDGPYEPTNCRWATDTDQARNRISTRLITYQGETKCLAKWAEDIGLTIHTLWHRLEQYGWLVERALTEPKRRMTGGWRRQALAK